jgi:ATP-dependent exoDNAse (exonuclease V) beta subunit
MGLTIYKSSAGSGKTFTLVRLFLEKVIKSPYSFKRILAITFTNKATEEMKSRIITELDNLGSGNTSQHLEHLISISNLDELTVRANAKDVLQRILHEYSSFSISTIDSYFQILSRTLARELKLPVKYNIELDLDSVCNAVADKLLDKTGSNQQITNWLEELLIDRIDNGKSWNIRNDLKNMVKQLASNSSALKQAEDCNPDNILTLIHILKKVRKTFENDLLEIGNAAIVSTQENNYAEDNFSYKKAGPFGFFLKIVDLINNADVLKLKEGSRIQKAYFDADTFITSAGKKDKDLLHFANSVLHPLLVQGMDYITENRKSYLSAVQVLELIYLAGITGSLNENLRNFRDEFQVFLLSDTTRLLQETIRESDALFIYEKSGNTFNHLFIDEFQDTSNEQWEILKPLIVNSLSDNNDVLLVGDAKQSIYRWRGGNMDLILNGVKKSLSAFDNNITEKKLDTNYRSLKSIVDFNNKFFDHAANTLLEFEYAKETLLSNAYSKKEIEQETDKIDEQTGYVEIQFLGKEKNIENESKEEEVIFKDLALQAMVQTIEDCLSRGYTLKDIAILVRTNANEFEIADHLLNNTTYRFISSNSLQIANNEKVNFIVNCFRLLKDPENKVLHEELNFIADRLLINAEDGIRKDDFRNQINLNLWTRSYLLKNKTSLLAMPLDIAYLKLLNETFGNSSDVFLDKFSDILLDFSSKEGTGIIEFLNWWDEKVTTKKWSVEIPGNTEAIRLISIHRSKGLQFPIVLIPFCDWKITPDHRSIIWTHHNEEPYNSVGSIPVYTKSDLTYSYFNEDYEKEYGDTLIDNLNVLYVAFTRAENELYAFTSKTIKKNNTGFLIHEAMTSEYCEMNFEEGTNFKKYSRGFQTHPTKKDIKSISYSLQNPEQIVPSQKNNTTNFKLLPDIKFNFESSETIYGNLIHELISKVSDELEIESAIHYVITRENNPELTQQIPKIKNELLETISMLNEKGWNQKDFEVLNEVEFCDSFGIILRPDRVLLNKDSAIILDFKTGTISEKYNQQVKTYCELLNEMGIKNIKGFLVYTKSKEIVEVI